VLNAAKPRIAARKSPRQIDAGVVRDATMVTAMAFRRLSSVEEKLK
jgi:hypothetical protein